MHSDSLKRPRSATRGWRAIGVAALLGATLILGACDDEDDPEVVDTAGTATTVTATAAVATPTETEAPTATDTATSTETATETITPPETVEREGVSFIAPEGWVGNADTWTSPDGDVTLLFATVEREPGVEPEAAMLPEGAVNVDREEIETAIGSGAIHTIEMADENVYERHAIVRTEDRLYDWWLAAESVEQLDEQQEALQGVLDSVIAAEED